MIDIHTYRRIEAVYTDSAGIFDESDSRVLYCKAALRALSDADRRLFVLYIETGSVRKLSEILGVSKSTVQNRVRDIRKRILKNMKL